MLSAYEQIIIALIPSFSVKDSVTWTDVQVGLSRTCRCVPIETLARHVCVFAILRYSSSTLVSVQIISLFGVSESLRSFAVHMSVTRAGNV